MNLRTLLVTFLLPIAFVCSGQNRTNISPELNAFLQLEGSSSTMVDLFLRGNAAKVEARVEALGGLNKMSMAGLVSARVPASAIRQLASDPAVKGIEFSLSKGYLLNDSMRYKNYIQEVHDAMAPLPTGFTGKGVVIGIIDSGLDLNHPDVKNADGTTRVVKYWDQSKPTNATTPPAYGYGQLCDSVGINSGTCILAEQPGYFGHGTTVAGTAAGNGLASGNYVGAAPDADLIIVSSKFNAPNWKATVADAVHFIITEAQAMGKPCVINLSLGDYLGSHDGLDASALLIDSLLNSTTGAVMVCAAGNSGAWPEYHLRTDVTADTSFTWFNYNPTSALGYGAVFFELWADTADLNNVQYAMGVDHEANYDVRGATPFHDIASNLGTTISDPILSPAGDTIAQVDYFGELRGGQYRLVVHVQEPDSNQYLFRFMSTGIGAFDVWSADFLGLSAMVTSIPNSAQMPAIVDYVLPDGAKKTVDSWACSPEVITVANYHNETTYIDYSGNVQSSGLIEGSIVAGSSPGPRRQDLAKPDIAASGDITMTAAPIASLNWAIINEPHKVAPDGMHLRQGGTSIASPVVAGAVALYLEKCPYASHTQVMNSILNTASTDGFTGTVPNTSWGAGKLNAFDALVPTNFNVTLSLAGDTAFCSGDSIEVSGPNGMAVYNWTNDDSLVTTYAQTSGPLSLEVINAGGCRGWTDTLNVIIHPVPANPVITQMGNVLECSTAPIYQWFLDGSAIIGADQQIHNATFSGIYFVQITDSNGCSAESDTVQVVISAVGELQHDAVKVWPDPATNELFVEIPVQAAVRSMMIMDASGRIVETIRVDGTVEVITIPLQGLASGPYQLLLNGDQGQWVRRFTKEN